VTPRALRLTTEEGSHFIVRFDPQVEDAGVWYGPLRVIGYSVKMRQKLDIQGNGCEPEATGRIVVSDRPKVIQMFQGEQVPVYETEVIASVEDITYMVEEYESEQEEA
jgi:hypothetical protein